MVELLMAIWSFFGWDTEGSRFFGEKSAPQVTTVTENDSAWAMDGPLPPPWP